LSAVDKKLSDPTTRVIALIKDRHNRARFDEVGRMLINQVPWPLCIW
jgi:hypothetical protein